MGGGGGVGLFQIFQRVILKYLLHKTQTLFTLAYILNTPTGDEMGGLMEIRKSAAPKREGALIRAGGVY